MLWPKSTYFSFLLYFLVTYFANVNCDDGLCGIEPPTVAGASCSGPTDDAVVKSMDESDSNKTDFRTYDYDEKPMTDEEKEIWAKRYYAKRMYTNNDDWPLHEQLDFAEEHTVTDIDKAIELFDKIIEKHPNSPRGLYVRARIMENRLLASNLTKTSEEYQNQLNHIFDVFASLMDRYEDIGGPAEDYDIMPVMFNSLVHHSVDLADRTNNSRKSIEFMTKAMDKSSRFMQKEQYHLVNIYSYLALGDFEGAEKAIESAMELHSKSILLKFFKGIVIKSLGRKKEGNRLLRSIDSEGIDPARLSHDMNNFGNTLFNNGQDTLARLIFQEASKLHIFKSKYQRPVIALPREMETKPVWTVEQAQISSFFRYRLYYKFNELMEFLPTLKIEALEAAKNINDQDWIINAEQKITVGNRVNGGNYSTLPLFTYGKKRRVICNEIMPKTCTFFKKNFERLATFKYGVIKLTVVDSKAKTLPLDGMTNIKLRVLVPIQIPEGFKMIVADSEVSMKSLAVIDESFEHRYDNENGDDKAIWLSLDIPHPDCTPEELKRMQATPYAQQYFLSV